MMRKTIIFFLLFSLMIISVTRAEIYNGQTVGTAETALRASSGGILEHFPLLEGELTETDQILGSVSVHRVFSDQDGIVSLKESRIASLYTGVVAAVTPQRKYTVMATSDKGYNNADVRFVHMGEPLYIRCTVDGSHLARGIISAVNGAEFDVEVTGGELFVGETVYLYREKDYSIPSRVGMGTVVEALPVEYSVSDAFVQAICVTDGQKVERGQLLFTWTDGQSVEVVSPVSGIARTVLVSPGNQVTKDQVLAWIVPENELSVRIFVPESELSHLTNPTEVSVTFASDPESVRHPGVITDISHTDEGQGYTVLIRAEDTPAFIGLSAEVSIE